ncbi:MAG: Hydrophobic amino acid transporter family, amino acid-binding protein [Rhizobium sp.]|nr:Hydrophobic amino acid transporter family, amino acid-binding protein [Rhizobium sp.]
MKLKSLTMASLLLGASIFAMPAHSEIRIGLMSGITGGAAAMAPDITKAYELAVKQVNDQGGILDGQKLVGIIADDGCNPQIGADAATKVVNVSQVIGLVGPWCSGALMSVANTVSIPAGIVVISPAATSPAITGLKDNDLVFRTAASDEYQGQALARTLLERGVKEVAVSFVNNDYGKGLAEAFKAEYEGKGGVIKGYAAHEDNRSSYRSDLAELSSGGAKTLVLFDYGDAAGLTILREAIENGFFENFVGGEGMRTSAPIKAIGAENLANFLASAPVGSKSDALEVFSKAIRDAGGDPDGSWVTNSYDAVFLMALAIEKAGGDKSKVAQALRDITKGDGEAVLPGEWTKAKELIKANKPITYKGASGPLDFDKNGDVSGVYALFKVNGDRYEVVTNMK